MRHSIFFSFCLLLAAFVCADEYTGRYIYTEVNPDDSGGLVVELASPLPHPIIAVAVGQRSRAPYAGTLQDGAIHFAHLPVDKYDLVLVTPEAVYEGVRLSPNLHEGKPTKEDLEALEVEIGKIEGFFDRKQIHRIGIDGTTAAVFLQQWREKVAVKQSGARIPGSIHSLDIIWFEKPLKGWQLVKRRQLYREELPVAEPLVHHHVEGLSGIRVIREVKTVGPFSLNPAVETP